GWGEGLVSERCFCPQVLPPPQPAPGAAAGGPADAARRSGTRPPPLATFLPLSPHPSSPFPSLPFVPSRLLPRCLFPAASSHRKSLSRGEKWSAVLRIDNVTLLKWFSSNCSPRDGRIQRTELCTQAHIFRVIPNDKPANYGIISVFRHCLLFNLQKGAL
ncbi:Protein of unknown function, partial [Gryllus bimaculatus]